MGNSRVTVNDIDSIVTKDDYYPFGLQMPGRSYNIALNSSIYKYAGKELDEESDLNWYYYGARYYDPAIGKFHSVDPLAHMRPGLTPYHYVQNNPINRFDPDGKFDWKKIFGISDLQLSMSNNYSGANARTSVDNVNAFYNEVNNEISETIVEPINETLAPVNEAIEQGAEVAQEATIVATKHTAPVLDKTASGLGYIAPFTGPFAPKVAAASFAVKGTATGLKIINKAVGGNDFTWNDIVGDGVSMLVSRAVPGGQGLYGTIAGDTADRAIESTENSSSNNSTSSRSNVTQSLLQSVVKDLGW